MSDHALTWGETPTSDDKLWGAIAHVSVFVAAFIGPLVVLLLFQEKSKFIKYHAIQALAFQVVMVVAAVAVSIIATITCGVGSVLYLPLLLGALVPIYGGWLAYEGRWEGLPGAAGFGR